MCIYINIIIAEIVTTVKGRHEDTDALRPKEALLYRPSWDFFTPIHLPFFLALYLQLLFLHYFHGNGSIVEHQYL